MRIVLLPCAPYELNYIERWANELAKTGWRLRSIPLLLPFLAVLEEAEPARYRLDYERRDYHGYYCRVPFVRMLLIEGEPTGYSPQEMRSIGYFNVVCQPIFEPVITLMVFKDIFTLPMLSLVKNPALFGDYPLFGFMTALMALIILTGFIAALVFLIAFTWRRSRRVELICYRVTGLTNFLCLAWALLSLLLLATVGMYYPI